MTIVEKIKALLAKAASTDNQHEAELFLAKAQELMAKHQLEAEDLERDDPIDMSVGSRANGGAAPDWDFQLMFAVSKYFGCKSIQYWTAVDGKKSGEYQMRMVGRESARITAIEMHKYLVATVRRLGREHAHEMYQRDKWGSLVNLKPDQAARRIGRALQARIDQLCPKQTSESTALTPAGKNALITLDRVMAKYQEMFPDARTIGGQGTLTTKSARAIAEGIGLSQQVHGSGQLRIG